jgi:peroxiredoxin Q/BCP
VIVYFYPKADTPGCTTQSCELRDHRKELTVGAAILTGIKAKLIDALEAG